MNWYWSHLNTAATILSAYKGNEPFSSFIKKYFSSNKKYGSTDRRQISHLCYCYFRLGRSLQDVEIKEKILIGLFLCSTERNEILRELKPAWNESASATLQQKLSVINSPSLLQEVFPWKNDLTDGVNNEALIESFFIQPDLFLRLRPGHEKKIIDKLQFENIRFEQLTDSCISLDNSSKIDSILDIDKEVVIQDYNSQQTGAVIKSHIINLISKNTVWDCCTGSGGKSIMLHDIYPSVQLFVSDVRETILSNLKKRFRRAGIKNYKAFLIDLSKENPRFPNLFQKFPAILADVPCSGSGTWGRTPEQISFFTEEKKEYYSLLQKRIVSNTMSYLDEGGYFIYITCSVFKKENEEIVEFIKEKFNLELLEMKILKGYDKKADTMFIAILKKQS